MKTAEKSGIEKTNVEVESLKRIALFLEGVKFGRQGNIQPLGNFDLEQLWNAVHFLQGGVNYECKELDERQ